ncbi:hypothetical protein [Streptomyces subrutilus]|uniref:Uncharacterized protein n=1 Tax=Streptomyces subrutilus TaxID=36818 RepID=A0A1E5PYX6_9ACTN|nr:hypothetical protein [Streptomyces subrutilus]OEJ34602.1 hypothetical protein BGK67_27615 [Streptomyces subrutilus]
MSQTEHEPPAQERAREERAREERAREERAREERAREERAQQSAHRSDVRELLVDGVVELRKRGELATRRADAGDVDHLEAMARLAAQRVAAEARPCA